MCSVSVNDQKHDERTEKSMTTEKRETNVSTNRKLGTNARCTLLYTQLNYGGNSNSNASYFEVGLPLWAGW